MFEKYVTCHEWVEVPHSDCLVDKTGRMKCEGAILIPTMIDNEPHVFADLWLGPRDYRLLDVLAVAFKNVQVPALYLDEVEGFVIDGDESNLHPSNIGYRFRRPVAYPFDPQYHYVPMATNYVLNKKGHLVKIKTGRTLKYYVTKPAKNNPKNITQGYYMASLTLDTGGHSARIGRHRLLLLVFKPYPNNVDNLDSNHINEVPGDDWLDNLEWSSRGRNLSHAYESGLRTQNRKVLIRHLRTGVINEYWSIGEGARALGLATDEALRYRIGRPFGSVFSDGTQVKYDDDPRDWVEVADVEVAIKEATQARPIVVRDCRTDVVSVCGSSSEAEALTGVPWGTLLARLRKDLRGPHRGYQFRYEDDTREWAPFDVEELDDLGSVKRPVLARNVRTGEERRFASVRECVSLDSPRNLVLRLREGRHPLYPTGWQYRYDDEGEWLTESMEASIAENREGIEAYNFVTGESISGTCVKRIAEILNLNHLFILKALRAEGQQHYRRWQFRSLGSEGIWPEMSPIDHEILSQTVPNEKHVYYLLTDVHTGERHYFSYVEPIISFLSTVNSRAVFSRKKKKGELLDGRYRCTNVYTVDHLTT